MKIELVSRGSVSHWSIDGAPPPCGSFLDGRRWSSRWRFDEDGGDWPTCEKCAARDPYDEDGDEALAELIESSGHKAAWPERMPFGKHKGLRMETLARVDPEYCRWMLGTDMDVWLRSCAAWSLIAQGHPQRWLRRELRRLLSQEPFDMSEENLAPWLRNKPVITGRGR